MTYFKNTDGTKEITTLKQRKENDYGTTRLHDRRTSC